MRLRQSKMVRWNACALQAHLDDVTVQSARVSGKQVFGTVIHHCLERYNSGLGVEECVELFKELWDKPETITEAPNYWPKYTTYGGLRTKGIDIVREYDQKNRWESREVLCSEQRFLVPFGEHELEGTVDHIEIRKAGNGHKTLRVIDFKTVSKKPTFVDLRLNIQFTTYIYATMQPEFWVGNGPNYPGVPGGEKLFEQLEKLPRRGVWYHLMTNQEIDAGDRDDEDFMRLYRLVTQIQRAEDAQVFIPRIGDACTWCEHTANCGITIPDQDKIDLGEA